MRNFSLNHLSASEFEEFCFDLLHELGFYDLNWRKGTGLATSPADGGRDIECSLMRTEVDGTKVVEKWFVECKHYQRGVPPEKIQGALTSANAFNPDCLLIIASSFLSNPAKDNIEKYKENNRPKFRIKYWEKPDLIKLTTGKLNFCVRYALPHEYPFIDIIHSAHWAYIKAAPHNTLEYVFDCFDVLDAEKRDHLLGLAYELIIQPRYRQAKNGNESLNERRIDTVDYHTFKQTCRDKVKGKMVSEFILSYFITSFTLNYIFSFSDKTDINNVLATNRTVLNFAKDLIESGEHEFYNPQRLVSFMENRMAELPKKISEQYDLYEYYCTEVIDKLFLEDLIS